MAHGAVILAGFVVLRHHADRAPGVAFPRGNGGSGFAIYREGGSGVDATAPAPTGASPVPFVAPVAAEEWVADELGSFTRSASSAQLEPVETDEDVGFIGVPPTDDWPRAAMLPRPMGARAEAGGGGARNGGVARDGSPGVANGVADARLPAPVYPRESRLRGEQGTVVLDLDVDAAGVVTAVRVVDASAYPRLAAAAVHAAKKGRFAPATRGGTPVPCTVRIPFIFRLSDAKNRPSAHQK